LPPLRPEPAETILAASDAFRLWVRCKRAACRRAHGCRGFAGAADLPACVPRLLGCTHVSLDAIGALVADRRRPPGPLHGTARIIDGLSLRTARLIEHELRELERRVQAKAARAGEAVSNPDGSALPRGRAA
jgi:hypothetical protein